MQPKRQARPVVDHDWRYVCTTAQHDTVAGVNSMLLARVRYAAEDAYLNRAAPAESIMADNRVTVRRRAGRPPAGAGDGEKVKDYPQLSIRVPHEFKARLNALSAVTGLAQWRVVTEAIDCFFQGLPETDQHLVDASASCEPAERQ